jgi:5-methylcytosine-specific restriction endonuclease McrA
MNRILLLDKNYLAISVISLRRAASMLFNGKVEPVSEKTTHISTTRGNFKVSTILKLITSVPHKAYLGKTKFSRKNVMIRDNYECQYCSEYLGKNKGTIDHVVPKSQGGASDYSNCVTCCRYCNIVKADKTPEEVGLKLKSIPKRPTFINLHKFYLEKIPDEWSYYLIGSKNE